VCIKESNRGTGISVLELDLEWCAIFIYAVYQICVLLDLTTRLRDICWLLNVSIYTEIDTRQELPY